MARPAGRLAPYRPNPSDVPARLCRDAKLCHLDSMSCASVLFKGLWRPALICSALVATVACSVESGKIMSLTRDFVILGVTYKLPEDQIITVVEAVKGGPFVRIRPIDQTFDLVADEKLLLSRNYQGQGFPLVKFINAHSSSAFESKDFPGGRTVCRSDVPFYSCGLRIEDGTVPWSVIFNRSEVHNSDAIRLQAEKIIADYRGGKNVRRSSTSSNH